MHRKYGAGIDLTLYPEVVGHKIVLVHNHGVFHVRKMSFILLYVAMLLNGDDWNDFKPNFPELFLNSFAGSLSTFSLRALSIVSFNLIIIIFFVPLIGLVVDIPLILASPLAELSYPSV